MLKVLKGKDMWGNKKFKLKNSIVLNILQRMMTRKKRISTVREAIEAMASDGSNRMRKKDVARILKVGQASVSVMLAEEYIPKNHHNVVRLYLEHLGYDVDHEQLFGYSIETILEDLKGDEAVRTKKKESEMQSEAHAA